MSEKLTLEEQQTLLRIARVTIENKVRGIALPIIPESNLTPTLLEICASFVTLTIQGELRGCIGKLEAQKPLAEDVQENAISAAFEDPRFHPVGENELYRIQIEVSRLTHLVPLFYRDADDLLSKLRPNIDGVILKDGSRRATFLPAVWEKLPDPAEFLDNLCYKMGVHPNAWRTKHLDVSIYQVEEFHEA